MPFRLITDSIPVATRGNAEVIDLTPQLTELIHNHNFKQGHAIVFVAGSTAAITTIEFEPGLLKDLPALFERLAPEEAHYFHEDTWHDGNGHSHLRAALIGCSLTIPFKDAKPMLGTWQQVVLIDFDNRGRQREVVVQMWGE